MLKGMAGRNVAFICSILFLVVPLQFSLSEVALSNIPGMFFTISVAYLLYKGRVSKKYLLTGAFVGGITLGVRLAEWSVVLSLLILLLIYKKGKDFIKVAMAFLGGFLIWFIPLVILTGWGNLLTTYSNQGLYILNHDSTASNIGFWARPQMIWGLFLNGYTLYFLPVIFFTGFYLFKTKKNLFQFDNLFALVWLLSYLLPLIFVYNLEVPRHILPLLPSLVLTFGLSLNWAKKYRAALILISSIFILLLLSVSLNQARQIKNLIPPTIAPVLYTKENFNPKNTVIVTNFTFRQFQYYAPEFENYYASNNLPKTLSREYVVLDFIKTKANLNLEEYKLKDTREFSGPEDIFPRVSRTKLYILERRK